MRERDRSDNSEVIERELRETRARVDRTIDQIQDRLSPGQLLDEGLRYFRNGPSEYITTFGTNLGHSVRDNPLPVAMIGVGIAWLAFGQRQDPYSSGDGSYRRSWSSESGQGMSESDADRARAAAARVQRRADETTEAFEHRRQQAMAKILGLEERASETVNDLRDRVAAAMDDASARWEKMKASFRERGHDWRDSASKGMSNARDAVSDSWETAGRTSDKALEIFEQQPLLAAAAGITVGAVLGSLFPSTQREREAMKPHADALRREAKSFGEEAMETTKEAGRAAADAALHAVDEAAGKVEKAVEERSSHTNRPAGSERASSQPAQPASSQTSQPGRPSTY